MLWAILLFANGTALLVFNQTLTGTVYPLPLPAPPLSAPVVLNNGTPVAAVLNGTTLLVPVLGRALITVEYVPRVKTLDGLISFNVTEGVYVIWAQGGVLLTPTLTILNYTRSGNSLLVVAEGPGVVAYTIQGKTLSSNATANGSTTQTSATQTSSTSSAGNVSATQGVVTSQTTIVQTTSTQSTGTVYTATTAPSSTSQFPLMWLVVAVIVVAVVAAIALLLLRRGRGALDLNDTDKLVLSYIKKMGGAYESDIARSLGLPRTTVFKSVRRLERAGLVSVEKRDGRNFVAPK